MGAPLDPGRPVADAQGVTPRRTPRWLVEVTAWSLGLVLLVAVGASQAIEEPQAEAEVATPVFTEPVREQLVLTPSPTPKPEAPARNAATPALDVEAITHKRTTSTTFTVHTEGRKVRDESGNHLTDLRVGFDVVFPEGPEGQAARDRVQDAIEMSRDRLCTVSRTVQLGAEISYEQSTAG